MDRLSTEEVNRSSAALERLMKKHKKQDATIKKSVNPSGVSAGSESEPKANLTRERRPRFSPSELSGTWSIRRKR
ncbi:hypothetical protein FOZ63_008414 [Perkinsus olseni]|nr:hypothetical protein FOZ63_008414 [Perkinsus olseni]